MEKSHITELSELLHAETLFKVSTFQWPQVQLRTKEQFRTDTLPLSPKSICLLMLLENNSVDRCFIYNIYFQLHESYLPGDWTSKY